MSFSFSFADDDIEEDDTPSTSLPLTTDSTTPTTTTTPPSLSSLTISPPPKPTAFPTGPTLLPPTHHPLTTLLTTLPERISYSTLSIPSPTPSSPPILLPRRELWDVRVQIMAEDEDLNGSADGEGLGKEDVKTGIYEGGFKSWECSVDLVRELFSRRYLRPNDDEGEEGEGGGDGEKVVLEMGCGTALPCLALLQWSLKSSHPPHPPHSNTPNANEHNKPKGLQIWLADYNPSVLRLVTLPNLLLSWAYTQASLANEIWEDEGELSITPELLSQFTTSLAEANISLHFLSGAWSEEFTRLFHSHSSSTSTTTTTTITPTLLILAAETIYSPTALSTFGTTLMSLLQRHERGKASALVGAKKVYFGVGGSMEDFVGLCVQKGGRVERIREEEGGVRREIVEVFGR